MFRKITSQSETKSIETLRFPLIVLVLFVHVIPSEMHSIRLSWDTHEIYILLSELISHNIGRIAVPCFFLFSGYFFFLKMQVFDRHFYVDQLRKRTRTVVVPYFVWNVLFVLAVLFKNFIFDKLGRDRDDISEYLQQSSFYEVFWGGPLLVPLWYLRDLICMMILSPFFYYFFKYAKGLGMFFLIVVYLMVWELNISGLSTTAFVFFGGGAFMGIYKYDLMAIGERYQVLKLLTAALSLVIATFFNATSHYEFWVRLFTLVGVVGIFSIGTMLSNTIQLRKCLLGLSSSVFFIYAIHEMYIINWLKGAFSKSSIIDNGWGKLVAYFTIPIVCLLVCLWMYRFMKKFFPNVLAILIGGRLTIHSLKE